MTPAELPSQAFQPRVYGVGAWTDNLHFAYDLVASLKPRVLVELGTDRGESYFAFCQSAAENQTDTRCFAVDSWKGDQQAGGYDETTFTEVSEHNAQHYAAFSTLLRCNFDEARQRFGNETVDLLHLDGLHTEEAVRHDLQTWLPVIHPGGILLMHDISVRGRDFGVWKVWEEIKERGPSYSFSDGPGLGVWQKPPSAPLADPCAALLTGGGHDTAFADYYRSRARELQEQIAQHWRDGTIRRTAAANQTIIQVFHTRDGVHREEESVVARVGHGSWKDVTIPLPSGAGAAPLRIDFLSAFTSIDIAQVTVRSPSRILFDAKNSPEYDAIRVAGDAKRLAQAVDLRLQITGIDPQLYLPPLGTSDDGEPLSVSLRMRVSSGGSTLD